MPRLSRLLVVTLGTMLLLPAWAAGMTFLVTTTADSGPGSLRQAIMDANANPGVDTINFNIPPGGVQTITPLSQLPSISLFGPTIIDGTTQPGYAGTPLVEINGATAGSVSGLIIRGTGNTVRGLVINRFAGTGIFLDSSGNTIEGNYIGTDPTGTIALGNG